MRSLRESWDRFIGPEATPTNHVLTAATTALGAVAAPIIASRRDAGAAKAIVASLLATDLVGGAYVNNTRACTRWYERLGQTDADHLEFAALHVHPAVVAWLDTGTERRLPGGLWALLQYGYLIGATVAIRRSGERRRVAGVAFTAGGVLLDRLLGPSTRAPWFAWTYYPKLLLGHAAASLWPDDDIGVEVTAVHYRDTGGNAS